MNNLHDLNRPEASRLHGGCLYLSWWKIPWSIYPPELAFGELSPAVRWSGLCDLGHRWSGEVNQHSSNKSDIYCTSPFGILSNINASHTFISGVIISWVRFKQIISSSELKGLKENTHTHTLSITAHFTLHHCHESLVVLSYSADGFIFWVLVLTQTFTRFLNATCVTTCFTMQAVLQISAGVL